MQSVARRFALFAAAGTEAASESTKLQVSRWREHTADKDREREMAWAAAHAKQAAALRELGFL